MSEITWTVDPDEPVFGVQPRVYADGKLICEVGNAESYWDSFDEWQANAHLIAASPDLLSAAKAMDDAYEAWIRGDGTAYDKPILALRAAIAKAEPARQSATTVPQGGKE